MRVHKQSANLHSQARVCTHKHKHSMRRHFRRLTGYSGPVVPDLAILSDHTSSSPIPAAKRKNHKLTIIDLTYTSEMSFEHAIDQKMRSRYSALERDLIGLGWSQVSIIILPLGVRGWHPVYAKDMLIKLGLKSPANRLLDTFSLTAWEFLQKLIGVRRGLELSTFSHRSGLVRKPLAN